MFSVFSEQHCFEQLVRKSTYRLPSGNGSLLNVKLCNDPFIISDVRTPFSVSDHCAVNFKCHGSTRSTALPAHGLCDFFDAYWNSICEFLSHCDWHTVFSDCTSCEDFISVFYA